MRLFRAYRGLPIARRGRPGHALTTSPVQGQGRVDNPDVYAVLYASDSPAGAVGEAFGRYREWTPAVFAERPYLPRSRMMLATIRFEGVLCDLDDPDELARRQLRPSRVVTRDRSTTQAWALRIQREDAHAGLRWWSFWDPDWGSIGLWNPAGLRLEATDVLTLDHPAVTVAADVLDRPLRA